MTADAVISRLRESLGVVVDPAGIPLDDPETYRLLSQGDTLGVRRFDHEDGLVYLRRLAPDRFEHLVAFQALNRMSTITTGLLAGYIERRHGRVDAGCEIPALSPYFLGSYGLPLYREQLQAIAGEIAGFAPPDAKLFASAFCRYDEGLMPELSARFVEGAVDRGASGRDADAMSAFFMRTASFMLPKALVSGFATEGYRLAWLKTHYRADFDAVRLPPSTPAADSGGP